MTPRKFQFSLRTAFICMLFAALSLGIGITTFRYLQEEKARRQHDELVARLAANRPDGFSAWDFSNEHMVTPMTETLAEDASNYCLKEGATQRILDQLVAHADDEDLTIELSNLQLLIVLKNVRYSNELKESFRVSEFENAYRSGRFQRVSAKFEDHYIGEKLRRLLPDSAQSKLTIQTGTK